MERLASNFKSESKTIKFFLNAFFFFLHLAIATEFVANPKVRLFLKLLFFIFLAGPLYKTIKHRYYTFWTISIGLCLYIGFRIYETLVLYSIPHIGTLYSLALVCLLIEMYILSSPIYYPRVNWWEYDFRFRDDLKINIRVDEKEFEARLTDLRRHAGCVASFEDYPVGKEIAVHAVVAGESVVLRGLIMSKRKEMAGRPLIYGIQFKFDSKKNKRRYTTLMRMWKSDKNIKKKNKLLYAN